MSYFRRSNRSNQVNIWPGFVDALSTVVLVFTFVIVGFFASQIYLSNIIVDKDSSMDGLQSRLAEVCSLFNSEKEKNTKLADENSTLNKQIKSLNQSIATLQKMLNDSNVVIDNKQNEIVSIQDQLAKLNTRLNEVVEALNIERRHSSDIKAENVKLSELTRFNAYRSEFFDALSNIVKDKDRIKIVGDRFVFQSELFFDTASDDLSAEGQAQVRELAKVIKEIGDKIPSNIKWILRVDGHTDARKISNSTKFASNWELSSARAISVVKHLVNYGIDPSHLVAAGFGEFQPIAIGDSPEDLARNRRIEFKLDER